MGILVVEAAVVIALLLVFLVAAALLVVRLVRSRRQADQRDDTLRVGDESEGDPKDAALRSMGKNSWMRPGGGGL